MRISDWSSDVCSSDLGLIRRRGYTLAAHDSTSRQLQQATVVSAGRSRDAARAPALGRLIGELTRHETQLAEQIGRASCRESVCPYVLISVVAVSLKKQTSKHK